MLQTAFVTLATFSVIGVNTIMPSPPISDQLLSEHTISLENRYSNKATSDVFKDNILLNIAYMSGRVHQGSDINWEDIRKPFQYEFILEPGKTIAYHDGILPEYEGKVAMTTNAHFNAAEGFRTSGLLYGDGVCHLASLMHWVALDAGLDSKSPTNHDFAVIPGIDRQYGVSIFNSPGATSTNQMQNLYITNNKERNLKFKFDYDGANLKFSVAEVK